MDISITVGFLSKTSNTNAIIFANYGVPLARGDWSEFIVGKCYPVKVYNLPGMLPKLSIVLLKITATNTLEAPMFKLEAIYRLIQTSNCYFFLVCMWVSDNTSLCKHNARKPPLKQI